MYNDICANNTILYIGKYISMSKSVSREKYTIIFNLLFLFSNKEQRVALLVCDEE